MNAARVHGLLHLPARAARALWWAGVPVFVLGWLMLPTLLRPSLLELGEGAEAIWRFSPVAAELLAHYPFTIAAAVLAIALAAWNHHRRTAAMSPPSLLLPTYLAALEAGTRQGWALACGGLGGATLRETHALLHLSAIATLVATAAPMLIAVVVMRAAPHGVRGTMPKRHWLSACAATTSAMLIWLMYDVLFFWSQHPL